jgi:hydrogenase nickel incorporation protein HypB
MDSKKPPQNLGRKAKVVLDARPVVSVQLIGAPGCGKTSLIQATINRLNPAVRVGVITADPTSSSDLQRLARGSHQIVQLNTGVGGSLDSAQLEHALKLLDLKSLDLLFIENGGEIEANVGEDVTVSVFSVATGDDRADKRPNLVRSADVVILNKIDLLERMPFDIAAFERDVTRLNPDARVIEVSLMRGKGIEEWLGWLACRINATRQRESSWFI